MRNINDARYLPGNEKSKESQKLRQREVEVGFRAAAPNVRAEYRSQQLLHVINLRNIEAGEELFVDYSIKYFFWCFRIKNCHEQNEMKSRKVELHGYYNCCRKKIRATNEPEGSRTHSL